MIYIDPERTKSFVVGVVGWQVGDMTRQQLDPKVLSAVHPLIHDGLKNAVISSVDDVVFEAVRTQLRTNQLFGRGR